MLKFVRDHELDAGFDELAMYMIELGVKEALTNIINYGFYEKKGEIQIECNKIDKNLSIIIIYSGDSFNPLNALRMFDISVLQSHKYVGGLGIFFILKSMEEISYKYQDGKNILNLMKKI